MLRLDIFLGLQPRRTNGGSLRVSGSPPGTLAIDSQKNILLLAAPQRSSVCVKTQKFRNVLEEHRDTSGFGDADYLLGRGLEMLAGREAPLVLALHWLLSAGGSPE